MTILIRRISGDTFEPISGQARVRAALQVFGKASVMDADTMKSFEVHEVAGQLVMLNAGEKAAVETLATDEIKHAARHEA